jgi:hypothetical protein
MVKVLTPGRRSGFWFAVVPAAGTMGLCAALLAPTPCLAQAQPPGQAKPAAGTDKRGQEKAKAIGEAAKTKDAQSGDDSKTKGEPKDAEVPAEPPPDPSQTLKISPVEVFKDANAEAVLDLKSFNPIRNRPPLPGDLGQVKEMSQSPTMPVDQTVIRRVVAGMVADLTDARNIQALIDPPPGQSPTAPAVRKIEEATTALIEPLFVARANNSNQFLTEYNRVLLANLQPLLKHHLVPRVQAMIVLGQSGNPEALKVFLDEIKNEKQTVWVKLWAMRGITNIVKLYPTRLTAAQSTEAARVIADLLDKNKELPWPVQLRGLEALAHLRQGFIPTAPKNADMAAAAMRVLADRKARPDVRAEASHALGMMQITNAVPGYNFGLVAHAAAQLAAQLGDQIVASYTSKGPPVNATRAEYLTSLLIGPIYQTFQGQEGWRDSGLLHNSASTATAAHDQIQKLLDQVSPVARAALDLVRAPAGQLKARRGDLEARVAALKDYLAKSPPANRHLVPDDDGFLDEGGAQAAAPAEPAAAKVAGARGER